MIKPEVGMGLSYQIGSDRYPGTIVSVQRNGREIIFQQDDWQRTKATAGQTENQTHLFMPDPNAKLEKATLRKDGSFRLTGTDYGLVSIGKRDAYRDPSF